MVASAAKRASVEPDWCGSCGAVEKNGKVVLPRSRKTFTSAPLIRKGTDDWETLREQVRQAVQCRLRTGTTERVADLVPMLVDYKAQFESRARRDFGECIFFTATKMRNWMLRNPGELGRYVPGHGYFLRVLPKLVRYVQSAPGDAQLSWKGFKNWLEADLPDKKPESGHPPGIALARDGKSFLRVAVACYVPSRASDAQRHAAEAAIASECGPGRRRVASVADDSEGGEGDVEQAVVDIGNLRDDDADDAGDDDDTGDDDDYAGSDGSDGDDAGSDGDDAGSDGDAGSDAAGGGDAAGAAPFANALPTRAHVQLTPSDDEEEGGGERVPVARNMNALKQRILCEKASVQMQERNIAVRRSNIAQWEGQLEDHFSAVDSRKRAREEEVDSMQVEALVERLGCEVDTSQEQRRVVAAYIKDLGEYADVEATLTEHFTSAKRQQRTFRHERGLVETPAGELVSADALVRHDYFGICEESKVAVVLEAKDECTYFNVGVAQMQLKRAEVSLRAHATDGYAKFYHAAYATKAPRNDVDDHQRMGHRVYSPDMTTDAKRRFFEPLKQALASA